MYDLANKEKKIQQKYCKCQTLKVKVLTELSTFMDWHTSVVILFFFPDTSALYNTNDSEIKIKSEIKVRLEKKTVILQNKKCPTSFH